MVELKVGKMEGSNLKEEQDSPESGSCMVDRLKT